MTPVKKAPKLTLSFTKERETKNTVRFNEDGDTPVVGTLYVQKDAAAKLGNPETLTVEISA